MLLSSVWNKHNFNHFQNVNYLLNKRWSWKKNTNSNVLSKKTNKSYIFGENLCCRCLTGSYFYDIFVFKCKICNEILRIQKANSIQSISRSGLSVPFIKIWFWRVALLSTRIKKTTENNNNQKCSVKLMHTNWFPRFQMMCEFFAISYVLRVPDSCLAFKL